mgnify:CR=1 FL=1
MSGENCVWKPSVINKKGEEVDSKLFNSLLRFSQNNREFAKKWYYIGTSEEFLEANRGKVQLDENGEITFNSLSKDTVYKILDNIVKDIETRLEDKQIKLVLTKDAKDYIIDNSYDESFGARPIKRYVVKHIESLIANQILEDKVKFNSTITIDVSNNLFIIK